MHLLKVNLVFFVFCFSVKADSLVSSGKCLIYRAKREGIPVFNKPETTSRVLGRLKLGQEVCYFGAREDFAVVDLNIDAKKYDKNVPPRYVRMVDLWPPRDYPKAPEKKDRVKEFFDYWQRGGIPDDPIAPFRSLWGGQGPEPKCVAGKICEEVERKLKDDSTQDSK